MIASEKSHENLSDYNQLLFKKRFEVNIKPIFTNEKMRNSDNCVYNYAHSFFGGFLIQCVVLVFRSPCRITSQIYSVGIIDTGFNMQELEYIFKRIGDLIFFFDTPLLDKI